MFLPVTLVIFLKGVMFRFGDRVEESKIYLYNGKKVTIQMFYTKDL